MNSDREPNDFTIVKLKEKLRELGLSTAGNKTELIARLTEADPTGVWMQDDMEAGAADLADTAIQAVTNYQREIELCRREKELAVRELAVTKAELQLLQGMQRFDVSGREQRIERDSKAVSSKLSITAIADMAELGHYNGDTGDYGNWEQQLTLLRRAYELTENHTKVLISMRLKGKALEWFHSDPTRVESSVDDLLNELREMFDHRPSRLELRKTFEQRVWQRGETFHEYVHAKTILVNRVPIRYTSRAALLRAFEKVSLREKPPAGAMRKSETKHGSHRQDATKTEKKETPQNESRCFNCGQRNHVGADCPTKAEGPKCFKCGERGHISSKCVKEQKTVSDTDVVKRDSRKRYVKEVSINSKKNRGTHRYRERY
ncbi:hypothetical protein ALC62_07198 [Cyphomyrmex costatus]|uniref:Gag-Pol polyprotein n=1 Tax=Cyphomyrmex costatus TaxID=456900 RepID=A0A151IHW8_9HYME|nr:hypothetical protein ALC62_07198 [Cyphomyrmex costatus]